jgi:prepilin-type N-terminal cleavage/methylation domain-containing protein
MKQSSQGFTLIEMLVVLFIITTIAGISVANFRAAEKQKRVTIAADTVINAIRNAQNFTLTGKNTTNANTSCRVPQFYVVIFQYASTFTLYGVDNCGTWDTIETYSLPVNTRIAANGLKLNGSTATTAEAVYFAPPFATITGNKDSDPVASFSTLSITVETSDGSSSKTVHVDGVAGRIE